MCIIVAHAWVAENRPSRKSPSPKLTPRATTDRWGWRSLPASPARPFEPWPINAKLDQPPLFRFGDIRGAAIRPAKAYIGGICAQHRDLLEDFAAGCHFNDRTLSVARNIEVA